MKTIWRTIGGVILSVALLLPAARAATGYGDSPVFAVDLLTNGCSVSGYGAGWKQRQRIGGRAGATGHIQYHIRQRGRLQYFRGGGGGLHAHRQQVRLQQCQLFGNGQSGKFVVASDCFIAHATQ